MKPTSAGLLWGLTAVLLFLGGGVVRLLGGRPMLFALLVLWGLGFCALVMALSTLARPKIRRRIRQVLMGVLCLGVALFGALEAVVFLGSRSDVTGKGDAMVILGANLWGEAPSPVLQARLDTALDYLKEHSDMIVVVSGGMADDEVMTEASCMAQYLQAQGVDPSRILLEERAQNTLQNLSYSIALLKAQGITPRRLVVVSNGPHLARVRLLARRCGVQAEGLSAPTPGGWAYQLYFNGREGAALVKSWLFDREVSEEDAGTAGTNETAVQSAGSKTE